MTKTNIKKISSDLDIIPDLGKWPDSAEIWDRGDDGKYHHHAGIFEDGKLIQYFLDGTEVTDRRQFKNFPVKLTADGREFKI